jgi:hypothetical protein
VRKKSADSQTGTRHERAANDVDASSRDHANRRAQSTRERSATSTRGPWHVMLTAAVVRCKPGPKYRDEVFAPGRQGIRAKRDFNPARGSATSFGTTHHGLFLPRLAALSRFLALSRGAAAWGVNKTLTRDVPDAMLQIVMVYESQGNTVEANAWRYKLLKEHPNSSAATKALK